MFKLQPSPIDFPFSLAVPAVRKQEWKEKMWLNVEVICEEGVENRWMG